MKILYKKSTSTAGFELGMGILNLRNPSKFKFWLLLFFMISFFATALEKSWAATLISEKYKKFTLYHAEEGVLKDDVIVVFHGFMSAMPNGAYKRLREALAEHYSIVGFNYDYFDIKANHIAFDAAWTEVLQSRNVTFVGTSLGGFWANYYAQKYNVQRLLLVNPVVDPYRQLQQFIGRHYVEKRQVELIVTPKDIENYKGLHSPNSGASERLVIVTRDDAILNYQLTFDLFEGEPGNEVLVFDKGGHTLNLREPRFMGEILKFMGVQ